MSTNSIDLSGSLSGLSIDSRKQAAKESAKGTNELGQSAFLELMIAQLKHQDPLSPQDQGEFISQLAQFSSVEGIEKLNSSVSDIGGAFRSSQALQASSLVGRQVQVPGSQALLGSAGALGGSIDLPQSTASMQVKVYRAGENSPVATLDLGAQEAGEVAFSWDGLDASGVRQPAGLYRVEASAMQGGKSTALTTAINANVNSVTVGANNSMTLNVANVGQVALSDVRKIL